MVAQVAGRQRSQPQQLSADVGLNACCGQLLSDQAKVAGAAHTIELDSHIHAAMRSSCQCIEDRAANRIIEK